METKCLLNIPNDECKSYMHMILASIKNCKNIAFRKYNFNFKKI